jgi:hypothetical protein
VAGAPMWPHKVGSGNVKLIHLAATGGALKL